MRTLDELFAALDSLTQSWRTLGHPTQHKVQADVVAELRTRIEAQQAESEHRHDRREKRRR